MFLRILILIGLIGTLVSCSALPQGKGSDLIRNYLENAREIGLLPIYPPSEEFQVGDVYFASYSKDDLIDLDKRAFVYIGTLQSLREAANDYLNSRINYANTTVPQNGSPAAQVDFNSGRVALNNGARTSLPLITYPSATGSAGAAVGLGGFGFGSSFAFGFGQTESVSVNFNDTRAYGLPIGGVPLQLGKLGAEFESELCGRVKTAYRRALLILQGGNVVESATEMCNPKHRICRFEAVTRTIRTRQIDYAYTGGRVASLAAAAARGDVTDPKTTLAVPGNINLDVTIGPEEANAANLTGLITALNNSTGAQAGSNPVNGLNFVGFQGNALRFERHLQKPVAIAYEGFVYEPSKIAKNCHLPFYKDSNLIGIAPTENGG